MSVIVNLKETFSTDSQASLVSKLNFNFNQLFALGLGQPGPIGPDGELGPVGNIGPTGDDGPRGNSVFSESTSQTSLPVNFPSDMKIGDILITPKSVLLLNNIDNSSGNPIPTWIDVADFSTLAQTPSVFRQIAPNSRIIKPGLTNGGDLTNSSTSTDPNYSEPGSAINYQTVLYNFDETLTVTLKNVSGAIVASPNSANKIAFIEQDIDLVNNIITITGNTLINGDQITYSANGGSPLGGLVNNGQYFIKKPDSNNSDLIQLCLNDTLTQVVTLTSYGTFPANGLQYLIGITPNADTIFPATSNLAVYSFFDSGATPAAEFQSVLGQKGYRHQIELGSVDNIPTIYPTSNGTVQVTAGQYLISPSFENLKIRKYRILGPSTWGSAYPGNYYIRAEYDLSSSGSTLADTFGPRRHSEQSWKINKAQIGTGPSSYPDQVIEMRLTTAPILELSQSDVLVDGIFLQRSDINGVSNFGIGFHPTDTTLLRVQTSSDLGAFNFDGTAIQLSNSLAANIALFKLDTSGNLAITNSDSNKQIRLNNAIVVKGDRLNAGLPFPTANQTRPILYSTDPNTLTEYLEYDFNPIIQFANQLPISPDYIVPIITNSTGKMTKIGSKVTIDITFTIRTSLTDNASVRPPYFADPYLNYSGSVSIPGTSLASNMLGNEQFQIWVTGIPNHWPDISNGGDQIKINVAFENTTSELVPSLRSWPMTWTDGTNTSPNNWSPIVPGSVYAKFGYYANLGFSKPALFLYGYRTNSSIASKFSVVDLFNPNPQLDIDTSGPSSLPVAGSAIQVSISGTYLTNHTSAQANYPSSSITTTTTVAPILCSIPTLNSATIDGNTGNMTVNFTEGGSIIGVDVLYYEPGIGETASSPRVYSYGGTTSPFTFNMSGYPGAISGNTFNVAIRAKCSGGTLSSTTSYISVTASTASTTASPSTTTTTTLAPVTPNLFFISTSQGTAQDACNGVSAHGYNTYGVPNGTALSFDNTCTQVTGIRNGNIPSGQYYISDGVYVARFSYNASTKVATFSGVLITWNGTGTASQAWLVCP